MLHVKTGAIAENSFSRYDQAMTQKRKLNLGCGTDIKNPIEGWVNLDSAPLAGVDVVHDIESLPLPFGDASFDEILCNDVLEHVEYIRVLKDLYRILAAGGTLAIRVPHFTSKNNFIDPTHRRLFSVNTFDFFVGHTPTPNKRIERERAYYFDFAYDRIASRRITFEHGSRIFLYNRFARWVFNLTPQIQELYESTWLSRAFPAENIEIILVK